MELLKRSLKPCVLLLGAIIVISGCSGRDNNTTESETAGKAVEQEIPIQGDVTETARIEEVDFQELIEQRTSYIVIVRIEPPDGNYYFGDLVRDPEKGWRGYYGGDFIVLELDEMRYESDSVVFIVSRHAQRPKDDGSIERTEKKFYTVNIERESFEKAIGEVEQGEIDAAIIQAKAEEVGQ